MVICADDQDRFWKTELRVFLRKINSNVSGMTSIISTEYLADVTRVLRAVYALSALTHCEAVRNMGAYRCGDVCGWREPILENLEFNFFLEK